MYKKPSLVAGYCWRHEDRGKGRVGDGRGGDLGLERALEEAARGVPPLAIYSLEVRDALYIYLEPV